MARGVGMANGGRIRLRHFRNARGKTHPLFRLPFPLPPAPRPALGAAPRPAPRAVIPGVLKVSTKKNRATLAKRSRAVDFVERDGASHHHARHLRQRRARAPKTKGMLYNTYRHPRVLVSTLLVLLSALAQRIPLNTSGSFFSSPYRSYPTTRY